MDSNNLMNFMLIVCIVVSAIIIFSNPLKKIIKLLLNGIMGTVIIYVSNILFASLGINVGVNIFTIAISTFLGLPGVVALFAIQAIL